MLSAPDVQVTTRDEGPCTVVAVGGEVDPYTALLLRAELLEAVAAGRSRLVLDLTGVEVLDPSALRMLIRVRRCVRAMHGYLDIVVRRPVLVELFHVTALDRVFALHDNLDSALAAHRDAPAGPPTIP